MTGVMAFCSIVATLIFTFAKKSTIKPATVKLVEEEEVEMISTL
jgi:hypothetical protein